MTGSAPAVLDVLLNGFFLSLRRSAEGEGCGVEVGVAAWRMTGSALSVYRQVLDVAGHSRPRTKWARGGGWEEESGRD